MARIKTPTPLYFQVSQILTEEIFRSNLASDTFLGTEESLMKRFNVSRITIRRALSDLESSGLVYREIGKGTFINNRPFEQELSKLTGFVEDMIEKGAKPSAKLIIERQEYPSKEIIEGLELKKEEKVIFIARLRLANQIPLSVDWSWIPLEIGKKIINYDLEKYPLYSLFEEKLSIEIGDAVYKIKSSIANEVICNHLKINKGDPLFVINRITYASDNKPILYEYLHYKAEKIVFSLRLKRSRPSWNRDYLNESYVHDLKSI